MGKGKSLIVKQSLKYLVLILVGLFAIFLSKALWTLPPKFHIYAASTIGTILILGIIFDAWSAKDALPFFKR